MKLVVTHAVRLLRKDLARLGDVHRAQLVEAIAPGQHEISEDLVETGKRDEAGRHGLVYLRFHDEAEPLHSFDGFLLDKASSPSKTARPDRGAFFLADTAVSAGVRVSEGRVSATEPSQNELSEAIGQLMTGLRVATNGLATRSNPPFALAKAPPTSASPKALPDALVLETLSALRYTESEIRAAEPLRRYQFLHSLRPKFATKTMDGMDGAFALGMLYGHVDPGPEEHTYGHRSGLIHVRFGERGDPSNVFDGWFWDTRNDRAEAYWPSRTATIGEGRIFLGDTVTFTGVEVKKERVAVVKSQVSPISAPLARGIEKLGLTFDVELVSPATSNAKGYFGSEHHTRQLEEQSGYLASQAAWKAREAASKAAK